ncbi:MAG: TatD family hydrolase [Planctomycetaceae bacterium]
MLLFDTHCHLDEEAFEPDRVEVVNRAVAAGVARILTIGTTAASSRRAVEIAAQFHAVYAVVGIQPNYVSQAAAGDWEIIEQLSRCPKVVAVGETGLDQYWDYAPLDVQIEYFRRHLDLARTLDVPFVVHCREAERAVLDELLRAAAIGPLRGVMHSFTGDEATARACVELGLYISFAGMVTYKKSQALRQVAQTVPLDRLLVETDAPYLAPQPMRGKRNEPAFVRATVECLAELLGMTATDLAERTSENAARLFRVSLNDVLPPATV